MARDLKLPKKKEFMGPAAFWRRILAFILDLLIVDLIIIGPFQKIILTLAGMSAESFTLIRPDNMGALVVLFAFISIFVLTYFTVTEYILGQTIGKMIFRLKVVTTDGDTPGFGSCMLRSLFIIPISPFNFLWILDPIYLLFNRNGQRLTEYLGRTITVQKYDV